MLLPGTILQGRYSIVHKLGEGGMGAVYEAVDGRFGTPIALKEIVFEAVDADQKARLAAAFEREAKSLAKARHEAIPFVRDYFSEDGHQFLVMELIEGNDLGELLLQHDTLISVDVAAGWLRQLLDALDYLHGLRPPIIHRDIKPQNLKLTSRKRLKLLDFGIAKSSEIGTVATRNQTFIGATLNYSPIEQILRVIDPTFREFIILKHEQRARTVLDQVTDARADIFAAGATFYHLLTDHIPEDATKRTLDVWEGKPDPLPHPSDLNPDLPRAFGDLLLKAMSIDRDDRFSSAAAMLDSLDDLPLTTVRQPIKPTDAATVPLLDVPVLDVPAFGDKYPTNRSESNAAVFPVPKAPAAVTEPMVESILVDPSLAPHAAQTDWSDLQSVPYIGDTRPNKLLPISSDSRATVADKTPSVGPPVRRRSKIFWIASAASVALGLVVIGGGTILFNASPAGVANTQQLEHQSVVPGPTTAATVSSTPEPDIYVPPTPVPTPSIEVGRTEITTPNTQTQDVPKSKRVTKRNSARGPLTSLWPVPKKKPRPQDPNCVYQDECKQ